MPNTQSSNIQEAMIFVTTLTFPMWQKYCRFRDQMSPLIGQPHKSHIHKLSEKNIRKYIIPSLTFKSWQKYYHLRQSIYAQIPQPVKTHFKLLISLLYFQRSSIHSSIIAEWEKWNKVRSDQSMDIINFGVISYDYRFQRPQQLSSTLAKQGNRVFYIETEYIYALTPQLAKIKVRKAAKNVYVVTLSAPANYFIYQDTPSQKGIEILFASLKLLLRRARIINPVAKMDHPFWGVLKNKLSMPVVYDVMDLHTGFKESGKTIQSKHLQLVKEADLVIASSTYLYKTLTGKNENILMLKNAGDYLHFQSAAKNLRTPLDFMGLSGRILGYYGALSSWLDTDMIGQVAQDYPSDSLVFLGRVDNHKLTALASQYPNIHLLGEKTYQDLPKYLSHFDVCLIPFKINELIKATNPVKIYEYFASGKPVVASQIPELKEYSKLIYFGPTPLGFSRGIAQALAEQSAKLSASRQAISRKNTWEMRGTLLHKHIFKSLYPKVSVVILVYNHADLSKISIDSTLYRSLYPNLELLAVDNKSDSETLKILKTYEGKLNIRVILNPKNYGFAKGNNVGMKLATGQYIILLNNDVRVTPGWIERLVYHARGNGVGLVGPVTNSIGNESKIDINYNWDNAKEIENKSADYTYAHWGETLKLRNIAAFAWLSPRSVYKKIGGLDEQFGRGLFEDDDYCVRVGKAGLTILCAEDAFVHHYGGASTNWGSSEFQLLFNTNKAKFEEKWGIKWTPHKYRKKS